jgi:hypothetical protein
MGQRTVKVRSVANYLRTRTGIPDISPAPGNTISAPYPYGFTVATEASLSKMAGLVRDLPHAGIPAVVRYDGFIESVDDAWVIYRMSAAVKLMEAYYEANLDRFRKET